MKPVKLSRASTLCYSKSVAFWVWGWFWRCLWVSPLHPPMIEWHDVQHWGHVFVAVCCLCERAYATDLCHWCTVQYVQRDSEQFRSSVLSNPSSKKERERGEILLQNQRLPTSKLNLCINSSKTQILWPLVFLMFPFVLVLTQYFTDSTSIINHNTVTVCNINLYHTD